MTTNHSSSEVSEGDAQKLQSQLTRNWYLLAGITLVSTLGLVVAVAPLLSEQLASLWPWANTHLVLLAGLVACIGLLVWHLTTQQRRITEIRTHFEGFAETARFQERQQQARLRALMNVSRMMGAVTESASVFREITNTCIEIFDCQQSSLMLMNKDTQKLEIRASTGHLDGDRVFTREQGIGEGIAGWVAHHLEPLILQPGTESKYPGLELRKSEITAAMIVPIVLRDELVGVLNISSRRVDARYTDEDAQALAVFAENAGACIRHSERAEWMRQLIERQSADRAPAEPSPILSEQPTKIVPRYDGGRTDQSPRDSKPSS